MSNDDDAGQEEKVCQVYNHNDFFTIFVQLLLAFLALCSLYIKRLQEVPRRTFRTWFLDVSKQGFGACYAHVLNMVIAYIIARNIMGSTQSSLKDECAWYGISYIIDTTLGLVLAIAGVTLLDHYANKYNWVAFKDSGVYVGEEGLKHWALQVLAWMFIMTVSKVIIFGVMVMGFQVLGWMGNILFKPIQGNIRFELVFVMILFPGLLNVIYFWVADGYLKAKSDQHKAHEPADEGEKDRKEGLLDSEGAETAEQPKQAYAPQPWSSV